MTAMVSGGDAEGDEDDVDMTATFNHKHHLGAKETRAHDQGDGSDGSGGSEVGDIAPDGSIIGSTDDVTPSPQGESAPADVITHGDDTSLLADDLINNDKWSDDLSFDDHTDDDTD